MNKSNVTGETLFGLVERLYPICRSITGDGVRETLQILKEIIPIEIVEVPSGSQVFDWNVPKEWNVRGGYIRKLNGEKVIDFEDSNLHILNYSSPVNKQKMRLEDLKAHLFTIPEHPDWIPYRTTYYSENWGFCLSHNQFLKLEEPEYEIFIDSSLEDGNLTYGEILIPGKKTDEVFISCHICHPSLCNDNLSGITIAVHLAKQLLEKQSEYSYRFVFSPATIGAITWLHFNQENIKRIKYGLVATLLGDGGKFHFKKSRNPGFLINKIIPYALDQLGYKYDLIEFFPYGYDERQYCSPGFDLPVGCLMRTPHGQFPEYHTSADNLHFVKSDYLKQSFDVFNTVFDIIENNATYLNLFPKCEPQLGKRGLYQQISGESNSASKDYQMGMLWILSMSDGENDLLTISQKSGIPILTLNNVAKLLEKNNLLKKLS